MRTAQKYDTHAAHQDSGILWMPDVSEYRNVINVCRISLKSYARRYLELHDEIADLDVMIMAITDELAPELIKYNAIYLSRSL